MTLVDRARLIVFILATLLLATAGAHAQSPEAESLFREGRRLIKAGKLDAGCDKLEASEKLESSVGTLLNLGDCREKLGQLASAWAGFRKAEAIAKHRGRDEKRRNEAAKRAMALEPKLVQLVVMVTPKIDGLVIKRGDEVVDAAMWGTPMPVDPDRYVIVAEAPGYKPWRTEVIVDGRTRRHLVTVPALEREMVAKKPAKLGPTDFPVAPQPPAVVVTKPVLRTEPSMWTAPRKVAVATVIAGAAATGVGVYFGMRSRDDEQRSNELCPGEICDDPEALRLNDRAQDRARTANILYAAGGVALATSAILWFVGAPDEETVIAPAVGRDYAGATFGGRF